MMTMKISRRTLLLLLLSCSFRTRCSCHAESSIKLIPLLPLRLAMTASTYTTMIGLGTQASWYWRLALHEELAAMAAQATQAATWQASAAKDEATAEEWTQQALADEQQAAAWQQEAQVLQTKAETDQAKAVTTEQEATAFEAQAATDEGTSTALYAQAAAEEAVVREDVAAATADAALVTADESALTDIDAPAVAACQVLPLVDVLCDVVGGLAAVGLETKAAQAAAAAVEEFTTAAAAQAQVESATASATEHQAAAVQEDQEAAALQTEAAALETTADEEMAEAQADQAAAEQARVQEATAEEAAAEEEVKAATEQESSTRAWQESVQHGAHACGQAIRITLVAVVGVAFWTLRIAGSILVPAVKAGVSWMGMYCGRMMMTLSNHQGTRSLTATSLVAPPPPLSWLIVLSHLFHHVLLFILCFGWLGENLLGLRHLTSIQAMGGTLLVFVTSFAVSQSMLLHSLPRIVSHCILNKNRGGSVNNAAVLLSCLGAGLYEFCRRILILTPLAIMEMLIVWINFGTKVFTANAVDVAQSPWLWLLFGITVILHICYFVWNESILTARTSRREANSEESLPCRDDDSTLACCLASSAESDTSTTDARGNYGSIAGGHSCDDCETVSLETAPLINPPSHTSADDSMKSVTADKNAEKGALTGFVSTIRQDFVDLRLLTAFEVLMASIMLALLWQSSPITKQLWPASKAILLAAHPHWHAFAAVGAVIALILLVCACLF